MNNRTCATCRFMDTTKVTKAKGMLWWKQEVLETKSKCMRLGPFGLELWYARGQLFGKAETGMVFVDGPCGAEGRFWEEATNG